MRRLNWRDAISPEAARLTTRATAAAPTRLSCYCAVPEFRRDAARRRQRSPRQRPAAAPRHADRPGAIQAEELQLAANDTCFSRFMISPTRIGNGTPAARQFPIACGVLNGFGGFLRRAFRRRRLSPWPAERPSLPAMELWAAGHQRTQLSKEVAINGERWHVRDADNQTATLTAADEPRSLARRCSPNRGRSKDNIRLPHHPACRPSADADRNSGGGYAEAAGRRSRRARAKIDARARKVIKTLIDVDLRR